MCIIKQIGVSSEQPVFYFNNPSFYETLNRGLIYTEENLDHISQLWMSGFLCEALACFEKTEKKSEKATAKRCIGEAVSYMEIHCGEAIMASDVSKHVGYEHSYFYRIFKREIGISPERYLMKLRIERAKKLIQRGYSFQEASALSGIKNVYYFSKLFKQLEGKTPSEYREMLELKAIMNASP